MNSVRSPVTVRWVPADQIEKRDARRRTPAGTRCAPDSAPVVGSRSVTMCAAVRDRVLAEHPLDVERHRHRRRRDERLRSASRKTLTGSPGTRRCAARRRAVGARARSGVALPVAHDVRAARQPTGSGVADQNAPGLFVADEHGFARLVAHRIVAPGRQPVLVAVLRPRVPTAGFGAGESELRLATTLDHGAGGSGSSTPPT